MLPPTIWTLWTRCTRSALSACSRYKDQVGISSTLSLALYQLPLSKPLVQHTPSVTCTLCCLQPLCIANIFCCVRHVGLVLRQTYHPSSLASVHVQVSLQHQHTPTTVMASAQTPQSLVATPIRHNSLSASWARSTSIKLFWPLTCASNPDLT